MSGIRLYVFALKDLRRQGIVLEEPQVKLQTCGRLGGVSGNKGGISFSFRIGQIRVVLLTAHLAAHLEELERRIEDYASIMGYLHDEKEGHRHGAMPREAFRPPSVDDLEEATRSDVAIFFGDLNFRIEARGATGEGELPPHEEQCAEILGMVEREEWGALAKNDQLIRERGRGRVFCGFHEQPPGYPTWPPTFKLDKAKGSPTAYNLKRTPAWTDRVLYKSQAGVELVCDSYSWHPEYQPNTSDHTPVTATFRITVPQQVAQAKLPRPSLRRIFSRQTSSGKLEVAGDGAGGGDAASTVRRTITVGDLRWYPVGKRRASQQLAAAAAGEVRGGGVPHSGVVIYAVHRCAVQPAVTSEHDPTAADCVHTLELEVKGPLQQVRSEPVYLCIRNLSAATEREHKLGEASVSMLRITSDGAFHVEATQSGLPCGFVAGSLTVSEPCAAAAGEAAPDVDLY